MNNNYLIIKLKKSLLSINININILQLRSSFFGQLFVSDFDSVILLLIYITTSTQ